VDAHLVEQASRIGLLGHKEIVGELRASGLKRKIPSPVYSSTTGRRPVEMRLLLNWVLSALAVWIVSQVVPGISVSDPLTALIAALVIGLVNATIGLVLKVLTFPLTLLTLGLFWFVINALMLELASVLVRGFVVRGFLAAFIGAIVLSIVSSILHWLVMPSRKQD
jgi:putative membrane protein